MSAAPAASSFATTFFMSQGARNCPFLTLTARPVRAAAIEKIGLAAEEGGNLQRVDRLGHARALGALVNVGDDRQAERLADFGEDRQRRLEPESACGDARGAVRLVERGSCRRARFRAAPRSPSAPPPSPAHAPGSPSGRARRSRRAAASRRTAPQAGPGRPERWGCCARIGSRFRWQGPVFEAKRPRWQGWAAARPLLPFGRRAGDEGAGRRILAQTFRRPGS